MGSKTIFIDKKLIWGIGVKGVSAKDMFVLFSEKDSWNAKA